MRTFLKKICVSVISRGGGSGYRVSDTISNFGGLRRLYTKPDIVCGETA